METDETLETGYGLTTPAGDNLCNDFARGEARGYLALAAARRDAVARDADLAIAANDGGSATPFGNTVFLERPLTDREWDAAARWMHDFYAARAGGPFMVFSAWPTPDLRGRGFGLVGHPPMMWRPAGPIAVTLPDGVELREVTDAATLAIYEEVLVDAYPVPELQPLSPGALFPPVALEAPGWRHWVGLLDGRPFATSSAFADDVAVHVEFISARPECRGRGVGAAMTAVATTHDTLPSTLISSDLGRPVYERLGYVSLFRYTLWAGHRGETDG